MRCFRLCVVAFMAAMLLPGCIAGLTSSHALSPESVQKNLLIGQTTKADVKKLYGEPTSVRHEQGGDSWVYVFEPSKMNAAVAGTAQSAATAALAEGTGRATLGGFQAGGMVGGMVAGSAAAHAGTAASQAVGEAMTPSTTGKQLIVLFDTFDRVKKYTLQ